MKKLQCFIIFIVSISTGIAQNISVEYSGSTVGLNQRFSITFKSENKKISSWDKFPEIPGFKKLGQNPSLGTQQQVIMDHNGVRRTNTYTLTQSYQPEKKGKFKLDDFNFKINDQTFSVKGRVITVIEARRRRSLFDEFFNEPSYDFDFKEIEANAFLSVSPSKRKVYVGEGVGLSVDFYVDAQDVQLFDFKNDLGEQLHEIGKKLKLKDCWIESFEITQLEYTKETINNKPYIKYHLGSFLLYPNAEHDLKVPSISVNMIKYKISEQTDYFGRRHKKAGDKTFRSRPLTIKVKPLPPHPLKNNVAVGRYELKENISKINTSTGDAVQYDFKINGIGNINMIEGPKASSNDSLTFFKPNMNQNIKKENDKLTGSKSYSYSIITELPGVYKLSDYINWIYFDPVKEQYDTLQPKLFINAKGCSISKIDMEDDNLSDFYDRIETADKNLVFLKSTDYSKWGINIACTLILLLAGYTYYKKKNG